MARLYFTTMGFDRTILEGNHIVAGVSHDVDMNWSWSKLSETRFGDGISWWKLEGR